MPAPQLAEQVDQAVQADCLQLTGHQAVLHFWVRLRAGQDLPPCWAARVTERRAVFLPYSVAP